MVRQPRQLSHDHAQIFRSLGHLNLHQPFSCQRVSPIVGHAIEIIEPISEGHIGEITHVLSKLLVIAVQVAKHGLQVHHRLAIQLHIHPEHPVSTGMMWPHGNLQQAGLQTILLNKLIVGGDHGAQTITFPFLCFSRISSCGVGSHS